MNSLKHAQAADFWIGVHEDEDSIVLELRDNGIGFDVDAPGPEGHFGMAMMRERAQVGGGTFDVQSAPGEGTTITVKFPSSLLQAEAPPQAVTGGAARRSGGRCFPRYIGIHAGGRRFPAKSSPHDDHGEGHDACVEQHVADRQHGRDRRGQADHVRERGEHVRRRHQVVLPVVDRRGQHPARSARCADRRLAHGHAAVQRDHGHVEREAQQEQGRSRESSVHPDERDQQRVAAHEGGDRDIVVEPAVERDQLQHESRGGGAPPVHVDPLEVAHAAACEGSGDEADDGDGQDDDHGGEG